MTIQEMHFDFQLKFNQLGNQINKYFKDNEIDWLLNRAVEIIVRKRLGENNNSKTSYEEIQKRTEDLKNMHIKYPVQPVVVPIFHEDMHIYELDLQKLKYPYFYFLRAYVNQSGDNCSYTNNPVIITQSDDLTFSINDPYNQSNEEEVLGNFARASTTNGSSLYLYPAIDLSIDGVYIEYLKQPTRMTIGTYEYLDGTDEGPVDCELSNDMHSQVVDQAVELAARIMTDPNNYNFAVQGLLQQE